MSENAKPTSSEASRRRFADTGGFTLIEVLVAFTVMATLLSVLFRGVVTMRAGSSAFDDHTKQQVLAGAVLQDALAKRDLPTGRYSGIREGRRWTLVATPVDLSGQLPPPQQAEVDPQAAAPGQAAVETDHTPQWGLQRLVVRLETKGRPLETETIRLVKAERRR